MSGPDPAALPAAAQPALGGLELLPDAVVLVAADGRVSCCNPMAARLLGGTAPAIVGLPAADAVPLRDAGGRDWWAVARPLTGDPRLLPRIPRCELELVTADGRVRPVTITAARLADQRGRLTHLLVCLRRAERSRRPEAARSDLLATLSHELRSPLASIRGFTRTLLAGWDRFSDEQKHQLLLAVADDAERLARLLAELLDVSRIDAGRLPLRRRMVDIPQVVAAVLDRVGRGQADQADAGDARGRLLVTLGDDLPPVYADPDKLERVFTNLVDNALRYSQGRVWIRGEVIDGGVRCSVADEGPGVPAADQLLVFTKFFRGAGQRGSGTGLGLYITKGLVQAHGGQIWVNSAPGRGAAFLFTLPTGAPLKKRTEEQDRRAMTVDLLDDIDAWQREGVQAIAAAGTLEELDALKARFLGKRSRLALAQRELGGLDAERRRELGARVNTLRAQLQAAESARREALEAERDRVVLAAEAVDVTLPPRTPPRGHLHPIHETMEATLDALVGLGYRVVTGPEVESDWFNFEAMNQPPDHPARSLHDTIYVRPLADAPPRSDGTTGVLLRTHTSPMQARVMLAQPPPVYVAIPGRTYRQDTPDATHLPVFHQIEGLAVDTELSFADLRGTLHEFARALLGRQTRIRLRPHYFPFTEPSCEVDAYHRGAWMELLGAGMVHPNVLRACGYDPERVQGFAFGIGVERMAKVRHDVADLRLFAENDLRFLAAF